MLFLLSFLALSLKMYILVQKQVIMSKILFTIAAFFTINATAQNKDAPVQLVLVADLSRMSG